MRTLRGAVLALATINAFFAFRVGNIDAGLGWSMATVMALCAAACGGDK